MNITIREEPPFSEYEERFDNLSDRLDQLDLTSLVSVIAAEALKVFETEGYGTWPALNPDYAEWKARNYPGQTILRLTDRYFRGAVEPGGPNNFIQSAANFLSYGVRGLDYPILHEEGAGSLPARPVFELMAASEMFQRMIARGVENLVREARMQSGL